MIRYPLCYRDKNEIDLNMHNIQFSFRSDKECYNIIIILQDIQSYDLKIVSTKNKFGEFLNPPPPNPMGLPV